MAEIMELKRAALVAGILEGGEPGELIPLPTLIEINGENCEVSSPVYHLAERLEDDKTPLPATAREALRLPVGARFADAVAALRERWGPDA